MGFIEVEGSILYMVGEKGLSEQDAGSFLLAPDDPRDGPVLFYTRFTVSLFSQTVAPLKYMVTRIQ